jgi:hypothetical protein
MAKPIKETPFLSGKDAKKFIEKIDNNKEKRVSREEYERVMANYRTIKATLK